MGKHEDLVAAKDELSLRLLRTKRAAPSAAFTAVRAIQAVRRTAGHNLHAIGVGRKLVDGKRTSALCVRFYVLEKAAARAIPRAARLPKRIAGLPTDVIESPVAVFHQPPRCSVNSRTRVRPVVGGISAAHHSVGYSATLGCFCRSTRRSYRDLQLILGCNHAFANLNVARLGSLILQPAPADGGGTSTDGDRIARLAYFKPLVFGLDGSNRVDAAIALVDKPVAITAICTIGPLIGTMNAFDGMPVRKHGRTTRYTEGTVTDSSMDTYVLPYIGGLQAVFVNQIRSEPTLGYNAPPDEIAINGWFAAPGDSGSVIVDRGSRRAVALHFAGQYGISVANPITAVCSELSISIP
jgi:hypothetical protein